IGAMLPKMADDTIHTGVLKQVQLDPERMDADKLAKWLNTTTPMDFHIFTITNLKNALLTGEKLNFAEIGPVKCNRYSYKYNVSWDIPNSRVSYKTLTTFDVLPESWPLLSQTAVGPNLFWSVDQSARLVTVGPSTIRSSDLESNSFKVNAINLSSSH